MDMLAQLREKNPNLPLYSVFDSEFAPYGRVLDSFDCGELRRTMEALPVPHDGNTYTASDERLEALAIAKDIRRSAFGGMEVQLGFCNGRGFALNALEYHKCSEVNYTSRGLVLLLALPGDIRDRRLDSSAVKGFYLPPDVLVEIAPLVLHFAPCRVIKEGFDCLVVLEKGVNSPIEQVNTSADGENALLWMRGKWLICHPDSPQAENGAYIGISGANIQLNI